MNSFEELGLDKNILSAIKELNFENPMPVQEKIIPMILQDEPARYYCTCTNRNRKNSSFWFANHS